jgi:hypothetical protein
VTLGTFELWEGAVDEYSAGAGATWSQIAAGTKDNTSSTTLSLPSLTATATNQMYSGLCGAGSTPSAGATSGFTYVLDGTDGHIVAYDLALSAGAYAPTATQASASATSSVGIILQATPGAAGPVATQRIVRQAVMRSSIR